MKKVIKCNDGPPVIGVYSPAIKTDGYLFVSGQIPISPETGELVENDIKKQTEQAMVNIGNILKVAGMDFSSIVKSLIFIKDMNDFPKINEVYGKYFPGAPPARSCVQVSRLPKDALIEIEVIALG